MLQTLELTNIRSYKSGLFEFAPGVNIVVGPNASGKTNLLEAIHIIARGHAFRSSDEDMINYEADWGRIDARHDDHSRSVKLQRSPLNKSFVIDDLTKKRLVENRQLTTVLFEPSDMLLLGGEPERRRQYLDNLLSQTELGFGSLLKEYKRTLAQRNRLLKQDSISPDHLFVWDVRLCDLGGKLAEYRSRYVEFLQKQLTTNYQSVSGNKEELQVVYETKFPIERFADAMMQKLKTDFDIDKIRGFTGSGPHRDDLRISINGKDARNNASRGETRSIVLALKISELKLLEQKHGKKPMLLLDDVFSELDGKRRRMLAQTLKDHQTFITTTDADVAIEHFGKSCNIIPL